MFLLGEGNGTPLQYSCLENPMGGGAWWAAVHGVTKSRTRLRDFTFTLHFHALEKEMATHSSVLAWRIPGMGEPGGLPSMESHRVRHDWSDLAAAAAAAIHGVTKSRTWLSDWTELNWTEGVSSIYCYYTTPHVLVLRFPLGIYTSVLTRIMYCLMVWGIVTCYCHWNMNRTLCDSWH